jgi:hypothetical protein
MEYTGGNCIPLSSTGDARVRHFLHWRRRRELHSPNSGLSSCAMTMSSYIALPLETSHWEGLHGLTNAWCLPLFEVVILHLLLPGSSNLVSLIEIDAFIGFSVPYVCVCVCVWMLCVRDDDFLSSVVRTSFTWIVVRLVLFGENVMEKQRKVDYTVSTLEVSILLLIVFIFWSRWIGCMPLYHMSIFLVVGGFFFL